MCSISKTSIPLILFNFCIILLNIILGHGVYSKSYIRQYGRYGGHNLINMNSKEDFINILRKLQKFPTIHLKDVIATYNAYKD